MMGWRPDDLDLKNCCKFFFVAAALNSIKLSFLLNYNCNKISWSVSPIDISEKYIAEGKLLGKNPH
jgi:hypothetical protein